MTRVELSCNRVFSSLFRRITIKHDDDFYCLHCPHSFSLYSFVFMPFEDTNILEFNQYQKSDKAPSIIYAVLESSIKKVDNAKTTLKNFDSKSKWTSFLRVASVCNMGIWWHRRSTSCMQKWRLHEKVLWILERASNEDKLPLTKEE